MPGDCLEVGQTLTARITGEVDHHAARELMARLSREIEVALPARLELDLGGVSFMDSSGIAVVLRSWKRMKELGGSMTLRTIPPQAAKVLKAAGVDKLIPFTD